MDHRAKDKLVDLKIESLIENAIALDPEANERWAIIMEIHRRATQATFDALIALMDRPDFEAKLLACDSLAQLGYKQRDASGHLPFRAESLPILCDLLGSDNDVLVAHAVSALGHQGLDGLLDTVMPLVAHRSEDARCSLATALSGRSDDASIDILIALSADEDDHVRDWATFGLGTQCERADAKIVEALKARIDDVHDDTRSEALVGLASKGDPSAKERVYTELSGDVLTSLAVEAARHYADPKFLVPLKRWRDRIDPNEDQSFAGQLDDAIEACTKAQS